MRKVTGEGCKADAGYPKCSPYTFLCLLKCSSVKMFLSSRQAGYSNRQQGPRNLEICGVLESDKCEVSSRYFVVGGQIAGCRHILTGLKVYMILFMFHWFGMYNEWVMQLRIVSVAQNMAFSA